MNAYSIYLILNLRQVCSLAWSVVFFSFVLSTTTNKQTDTVTRMVYNYSVDFTKPIHVLTLSRCGCW